MLPSPQKLTDEVIAAILMANETANDIKEFQTAFKEREAYLFEAMDENY